MYSFPGQLPAYIRLPDAEGISDIREESDRDGMRIVIELKKDANAQVVLNTLYKHTQLQEYLYLQEKNIE